MYVYALIIAHCIFTYKMIYMNNLCEGRDNINSSSNFFKIIKTLVYAAAVYLGIKYILPILMPFLFGLSIAALVQKPAKLLSSRVPHISKKTCCVIMTVAIMLITSMLIFAAFCSIFSSAINFCPSIPGYLSQAEDFINHAAADSGKNSAWGRFVNFIALGIEWGVDFMSENYKQYLPSVLSRSTKFISYLPSFLTATTFGIISALFACGEFDKIRTTIKSYLPEKVSSSISFIIQTTVRTIVCILKTYGTLMIITFGELTLGLLIIRFFGYNTGNIVTTSFIIALIDVLPILGTGTVLVPWGIFEIITGNSMLGIMILIMFAVIGLIRNFLEPKFMGNNLELHPFFTLAGVYIGGKLFGASGIIILPLAMIIMRNSFRQRKIAADQNSRGN